MNIKIINKSNHPLPSYQTEGSAGMDLRANLDHPQILKPLERKLIPTGLYMELPFGFEAQIRPRSGLAFKYGVTVLNSPGTIDADYRGEVMVLLINQSPVDFEVKDGERVAQMVIAKHEQVNWISSQEISVTSRGTGGYGSTGTQ